MAPPPAARPLVLVRLVAVAGLITVRLVPRPLVAACLPGTVVVRLPRLTFVPARLVVVALVPGRLVRVWLGAPVTCPITAVVSFKLKALLPVATRIVTVKFAAVRLAGNSVLGRLARPLRRRR